MRINRGKLNLQGVAEKALEFDAEKVIIVNRWKGGPGKIEFYKLGEEGLQHVPPLIYLRGVKLRREFPQITKRRRIKSLAIEASPEGTAEVKRLEEVLSRFLDIPLVSHERAYSYDALMQIKTESSDGLIVTFKMGHEMVEIGPRMRISHLIWEI